VGRLSRQVKPHREATSPKIILGADHLDAKNAQEPKRTPGGKKKALEAPINLYKLTFSSLGPTSHVNLLLDVKVISS
jgi:hypothetical protein